jgi:hypothetical protein
VITSVSEEPAASNFGMNSYSEESSSETMVTIFHITRCYKSKTITSISMNRLSEVIEAKAIQERMGHVLSGNKLRDLIKQGIIQ